MILQRYRLKTWLGSAKGLFCIEMCSLYLGFLVAFVITVVVTVGHMPDRIEKITDQLNYAYTQLTRSNDKQETMDSTVSTSVSQVENQPFTQVISKY